MKIEILSNEFFHASQTFKKGETLEVSESFAKKLIGLGIAKEFKAEKEAKKEVKNVEEVKS